MRIEITSNINFCLENPQPKFIKYRLNGNWGLNFFENTITWSRENLFLGKQAGDIFYKICEDLRGAEYDEITKILRNAEILIQEQEYSIQELDIIKAIANIFLWAQYFLLDDYDIENSESLPKLYDDFIIDLNNKPTTQKDIYLLPKKYSDNKYSKYIKNLKKINLLSELKVTTTNREVNNYFIPFTKPGYKQDVFQDSETYNFWKKILEDRHNNINNFFNKR